MRAWILAAMFELCEAAPAGWRYDLVAGVCTWIARRLGASVASA